MKYCYIANLAKLMYFRPVRIVNIGELKNHLSAYLQYVRNGEEVVVNDRNTPVARILPIGSDRLAEHEARLVASGAITLPAEKMSWDELFSETGEEVSDEAIAEAVRRSRGRW
jgi:prevent-host-death family protein